MNRAYFSQIAEKHGRSRNELTQANSSGSLVSKLDCRIWSHIARYNYLTTYFEIV